MTLIKFFGCFQPQRTQPPPDEEEDAEEEETEELGHVDTYAEYKPSKCRPLDLLLTSSCLVIYLHFNLFPPLNFSSVFFFSSATIGISHPDIVVETNTLSSVPPPDITYTLSIPELTISSGLLSALQLEAIIYACQVQSLAHNTWNSYSKFELLMFWLCMYLCSCVHASLCACSNTRWSFRITKGQASSSEMGRESERDALWQESSWRTTWREGRKHYG